jgi:predicted O-methyltransferase YrrM
MGDLLDLLPIRMAQQIRDRRVRWQIASRIGTLRENLAGVGTFQSDLLTAVETVIQQSQGSEERAIFARIEGRRAALLADPTAIERVDYGVLPDGSSNPEYGVPMKTTVAKVARASKSAPWCELLFHLIRKRRPEHVLEMGTCVGMSASYIAAALAANGRGRLVTIEGASSVAELARATFQQLGYSKQVEVIEGPFHRSLESAIRAWTPLDLVFVDGHHDGEATVRYFELIRKHAGRGALLLFDDIRWSASMREAWQAISQRVAVGTVADLGDVGIVQVKESLETVTDSNHSSSAS